ncbi:MAG: hypothetical protein P8X76_15155, partial [Maritimibacter sp.]
AMTEPEVRFDYGPNYDQTVFLGLFAIVVAAVFIWGLHFTDDGAEINTVVRWGITTFALVVAGAAVGNLLRLNSIDDDRLDVLILTAYGIDYRPRTKSGRAAFVAYANISTAKTINTEEDEEFRIKHSAGKLTLQRSWFDDRSNFERFTELVVRRSGLA